jgi:hypothetical protein
MAGKIKNTKNAVKARLGWVDIPVPARSGGVKALRVQGWYLLKAKQVQCRVSLVTAPGNNGKSISAFEVVDWPKGRDRIEMRKHLLAVGKRYLRAYRAREWPVRKNYLTHCNAQNVPGFISGTCSSCSAGYCTLER